MCAIGAHRLSVLAPLSRPQERLVVCLQATDNCGGYHRVRSRIVKIFELAFLLEVTPPTIAALHLVFRPPITDTHRQEGRRRLQGRGDGLATPARVYHGDGRSGTAATQ